MVMDPDKSGIGEGEEGGNDQSNTGGDDALVTMQAELKSVKDKQIELETANAQLLAERQSFDQRLIDLKREKEEKPAPEEDDSVLDELTPSQLFKKLKTHFDGSLSRIGEDLRGRITQKEAASEQEKMAALIEQAKIDNPDFMDHRKEIHALAIKYPTLTPQDAYDMVMLRKQKEAAKLAKVVEQKRGKEARTFSERGSGTPRGVAGAKSMTKEEAAEAAWAETMGD
jgi:hypothetical protein